MTIPFAGPQIPALAQALGPEIVEHRLFMKRIEVDKTAGLEGAALRDYYIWHV